MAVGRSKNWLLCCLAVCLATAGCLGGPVATGDDPAVTAEEAKERALDAERTYVADQFENTSCVEGWGLNEYAAIDESATVINRTADGVSVRVSTSGWTSTTTSNSTTF